MLPFGEYDVAPYRLRAMADALHYFVGASKAARELLAVLVKIEWKLCDTGLHRGLCDGRSLPDQDARIKCLGDDVVGTKMQSAEPIGAQNRIGNIFLG